MKKLLSILLSITLGVTSVTLASYNVSAFAAVHESPEVQRCSGPEIEPVETIYIESDNQASGKRYLQETSEMSLNEQVNQMLQMSNLIRVALLSGSNEISIADRKIPSNSEFIPYMNYFCPYLDGDNISITMYIGENNYNHIEITNRLSTSSTKAWVSTIDARLKELRSIISKAGSDPADRALALHDYMASHYYYDETYKSVYPSIMLTQSKGVCQSYAYLFQYIMATDGVECYTTIVHSEVLNHAWNIIKIGGSYYHVDVTWDDPIHDYYGMVRHEYFLVSDKTLYGLSDRDPARAERNLDIDCNDSSYEKKYFSNAWSPIVLIGDDRYFVDFDEGLSTCKANGSNQSVIDSLGIWNVMDSDWYYGNKYSGLYKHGAYLYYNTATAIKSYNTVTGETSVVANPDVSSGIIYGSAGFGNELRYSLQREPSVPYTEKSIHSVYLGELIDDSDDTPGDDTNDDENTGGNGGSSGGGSSGGDNGGGNIDGGGSSGGDTGGGGGGTAPSEPEDGNITNSGSESAGDASTNVDVKDNTTVTEGKAETKVDADLGSKIVENAVENKSTDVVIKAETEKGDSSASTVALPASTINDIADKTEASVTIKTDSAEVSLDKAAVDAVAAQAGTSGDVKLIVETKEHNKNKVEIELNLETSNGAVTDFKGGNVTVTVPVNDELAGKKIVCVYIDENGKYTKMEGKLAADGKSYTFTTGHFSTYAILEEAEADAIIAEQNKPAEEAAPIKVGSPAVKLYSYKGGKLKVTASAKNATGYRVYYKKSTWKKYKTYTKGNVKTLDKTFKKLAKGKYTVKVKAYSKAADGKLTLGAASKAKTITVKK